MKKMKEINEMSDKDLSALVNDNRETIRSYRFGAGGMNVKEWRSAKKEIARALTALQARNQGDTTPNA